MTDNNIISGFRKDHYFLSNFFPSHVVYRDRCHPTAEHAFQSAKNNSGEYMISILIAKTPGLAKKLGRQVKLVDDWEDIKDTVMEEVLLSKFSDGELLRRLLDTGDNELVEENQWGDTYWGVCNGVGENKLGLLLMKIRDKFKK